MPTVIREDTLNQFPWQTIETTTDEAGTLQQRVIHYDNGVTRLDDFADGVLSSSVTIDESPDGTAVPWRTIRVDYDSEGQITRRLTEFDNDTIKIEEFDAGQRISITQVDNSEGGNAVPWQDILTEFDADGQVARRSTGFDNGTIKIEEFDAGQRISITQVDNSEGGNAVPWQDILTEFDADGQVSRRSTGFDNGTIKIEEFDAGQRISITQVDNSEGGNAVPWQDILTEFDADGQVARRSTGFDNGTIKIEEFDAGQRVVTEQIDQSDGGFAVPWSTITTRFDQDGDVQSRLQVMDNADQFVFEFADGDIVRRAEFDGNDTDSWLFEVTSFDDQGSVQDVVTYDTFEEAPLEIIALFEFDGF